MATIKIKKGDRVRSCEEADFKHFEKQGYSKAGAPKAPKKPTKKAPAPNNED